MHKANFWGVLSIKIVQGLLIFQIIIQITYVMSQDELASQGHVNFISYLHFNKGSSVVKISRHS